MWTFKLRTFKDANMHLHVQSKLVHMSGVHCHGRASSTKGFLYFTVQILCPGLIGLLLLFMSSVVSDSLWPHGLHAACQASLSFTISWSLLKLMSIECVMPSNHLILCHPPLLLPAIFPSIRIFSHELALHIRCPKYWSFSFRISPSGEYSELISFRIDWFDLSVQGTLKSLLQHHSSKSAALRCSAFFGVS